MAYFALKLLLLLTTSTTITVQGLSSAPQRHEIIRSGHVRSRRSPSELNLFGRSMGGEGGDSDGDRNENDGSSNTGRYGNRRGGMLRKDVKKLESGFDTNPSKTEARHAWKKKKYQGAGRDYPSFLKSAIYRYRGLKQKIRYLFYRNTVYVLECENDKYYVGSTNNRKRRYREHFEFSRGGSKWTRMHRPIRVVAEYKRIPSRYLMGMESQKTAETMIEHGVNNVRGGPYCYGRNFTTSDLSSLTAFLGHYNQLDYKELSQELRKVLPRPDPTEFSFPPPARNNYGAKSSYRSKSYTTQPKGNAMGSDDNNTESPRPKRSSRQKLRRLKKKQRASRKANSKCYKCGQTGHWAYECPNDPATSPENRTKSPAKVSPGSSAGNDESTSFEDSIDQWVSASYRDVPLSKPSIEDPNTTVPEGSPQSDEDKLFNETVDQFFRSASIPTTSNGDNNNTNGVDDSKNRHSE